MRVRLLTFLALVVFSSSVWAQGYSIEGNRIVINTKDHWMDWKFPRGVVDISDNGQVSPAYIRKNINASLDAHKFVHDKDIRGGIRDAGSNLGDAPNIIDGDMDTWWEPDKEDSLKNWRVDLDLGRLVAATKIVVRFVEEGQGDPFLGFKVFTSTGEAASLGSKHLSWERVGMTEKPNEDRQRVFEFELKPLSTKWEGEGVDIQYVRFIATDSHGHKAEEIPKEEYESLDPDLRGTIEHYKKISPTEERFIPKDGYEALSPEEKGSIKYYRREVPRLAELEVWSLGDNISLGIVDRGGALYQPMVEGGARGLVDGSYMTFTKLYDISADLGRGGMFIDLGATFWIDTVRMITTLTIKAYRIRVSEGLRAFGGSLIWETLTPESRLARRGLLHKNLRTEDRFQLRKVRFIDLEYTYEHGLVEEFQVYGHGYVSEITLTSPPIKVGPTRSLSSIGWQAHIPSGTQVKIRTRTGDTLDEKKHYFDSGGNEVTLRRYNDLPGFAQGPITTELVPGSNWSSWSEPYQMPGDLITSPSPRGFLQIEVRLLSNDPNSFASINSLSVDFFRPLTQETVAEVFPFEVDRAGVSQDFSFFIHPTFVSRSLGFEMVMG